jgi:hypothetical protein
MKNHEDLNWLLRLPLSKDDEKAFRDECVSVADVIKDYRVDQYTVYVLIANYAVQKAKNTVAYQVLTDPMRRAQLILEEVPKELNKFVDIRKKYLTNIAEIDKVLMGWYDEVETKE